MLSFLAAFLPLVFFLVLWVVIVRKRGLEFQQLVNTLKTDVDQARKALKEG
jgi:hypothetical protein